MSKVTSKRQVTIPKSVADRYGIKPGDRIRWVPAGDEIRVLTGRASTRSDLSTAERLALFDRATERRNRAAESSAPDPPEEQVERGWHREDLYDRGRSG